MLRNDFDVTPTTPLCSSKDRDQFPRDLGHNGRKRIFIAGERRPGSTGSCPAPTRAMQQPGNVLSRGSHRPVWMDKYHLRNHHFCWRSFLHIPFLRQSRPLPTGKSFVARGSLSATTDWLGKSKLSCIRRGIIARGKCYCAKYACVGIHPNSNRTSARPGQLEFSTNHGQSQT